jgi:hypothetical protein
MLSLISTLGGLLISGLPKVLDFFQNKADQKHEIAMAEMQTKRELELAAAGFAAQAKVEEIRTDQIQMQTDADMTKAAYEHDAKVLEKAAGWVSSFVGTVRPVVTYLFVLELVGINAWLALYISHHPELVKNVDDLMRFSDALFSTDEMSMLGGIIGYWFGSRGWQKK